MNRPAATPPTTSHETDPLAAYSKLFNGLTSVIKGHDATLRLALSAFFTGGHLLLEDYPGTGKTTLAKALARLVGADFQRIQFTPDLLPNDILGVSIYNPKSGDFTLHRGPVFTEILLADEINRASPRTQSALLEAMAERQVSLDGELHRLPQSFFVIATQNPIELHGTYPLPEAQMDRFAMRLSLGYVSAEDEVRIMSASRADNGLTDLSPILDATDLAFMQAAAAAIPCSEELLYYIVRLVSATRELPELALGASPRASITIMQCAQALAMFDGVEFVTPDHIQEVVAPCLNHRLIATGGVQFGSRAATALVQRLLRETDVPR